ncbi:MAG: hypothetical protein DKT66_07690 [Candidatus Melainabacteria bacterium]|nr:MAG: hypothetical protein DKT66_07690 [Candidatus Melainabacteria bacterium]
MPTIKTLALLLFAVALCGIAAVSIERSIRLSGQSKEQISGAQKVKLQAQIEQQQSEIAALPQVKTSAERLVKAEKMEELGTLLWQDQKLKESLAVLTKALALEKEGGAGNDRIVATLNQIATVCRDSNKYDDMLAALRQIQTLNEHDPQSTPEIRIRDKQNMASCNFLLALQEAQPSKRRQQLQLTQTTMEELKRELLQERSTEKLNPGERSLLATINENLASVCEELGDTAAAKPLKDEAQTLRSATR